MNLNVPTRRRFHVLDAMVLVAATALGLALTNSLAQAYFYPSPTWAIVGYVDLLRKWCPPCLASWTIALFALGLRPPRARSRRLFCQPGMVACTAATLIIAVGSVSVILCLIVLGPWSWHIAAVRTLDFIPPSVAGAWLILVLGGRWRSEATWLDRTGRLVGALWVTLLLAGSWGEVWHFIPHPPALPIPFPPSQGAPPLDVEEAVPAPPAR